MPSHAAVNSETINNGAAPAFTQAHPNQCIKTPDDSDPKATTVKIMKL